MADYFRRPLRLSPQEGLALVSAGSALLAVPGADPDGALGHGPGEAGDRARGRGRRRLRRRAGPGGAGGARRGPPGRGRSHGRCELDYYSFGRDGHSTRVVQPWRVFNAGGPVVPVRWCELAEGERLFRVDRISRAECSTTDVRPRRPDRVAGATDVFHPAPDDPRSCSTSTRRPTGSPSSTPTKAWRSARASVLRVTLRTSQQAWLERLLLRAGPHAGSSRATARLGAAAASRILRPIPARSGRSEYRLSVVSLPVPADPAEHDPPVAHDRPPADTAARCARRPPRPARAGRRASPSSGVSSWSWPSLAALLIRSLRRPALLHPVRVDGADAQGRTTGSWSTSSATTCTASTGATSSSSRSRPTTPRPASRT